MAAVLAEGTTVLYNAAQEPEINEADGEPIFHADEEEGEDHE